MRRSSAWLKPANPTWIACLLAFGLCAFQAPEPKRTPPPAIPPPPPSYISAMLKVSGNDIVSMLNDRTRSQLARINDQKINCLLGKCSVDLTAVRTGEITGHAQGAGMQLTLPFALRAHVDLNAKDPEKDGDALAQGIASGVTQLVLTPDWRIDAHTEGDLQLSNAKLRLGPLKVNVAKLWHGSNDSLTKPIFKAVDKEIASALKLHGQVGHLWRKLHQPILISKTPNTWLLLSPERLRVTPLQTIDDNLVFSVAAEVRAKAVVGGMPTVPDTPPPMPAPEQMSAPSDSFAVSVPVTLSFTDAARIAMQHLKQKPLHAGKLQLRVDKLQILPSGDDLVVKAQFCVPQAWDFTHLLDSCGQVYLRGMPQFDSKTGTIRVSNLHYDIASQNLMLRLVRALAGSEFGNALEQDLVFDESREIARLKEQVMAALTKPQGRGIVFTGHLASFEDPRLSWDKNGFVAMLNAKGTLSTALEYKGIK